MKDDFDKWEQRAKENTDNIMSKEQTPKPKKPKCICEELIKTKSIGWCPACKTDYI